MGSLKPSAVPKFYRGVELDYVLAANVEDASFVPNSTPPSSVSASVSRVELDVDSHECNSRIGRLEIGILKLGKAQTTSTHEVDRGIYKTPIQNSRGHTSVEGFCEVNPIPVYVLVRIGAWAGEDWAAVEVTAAPA